MISMLDNLQARHFFWISTAAAIATILLKTLAWWVTGSVGLLSDAMESFVNLAGAVFALWMITIARCPPDAEHPLGHAKAEYFSAGFEGILIFGAAGAIIWSAVMRLLEPQPLEALGFGLALSVGSSVINLLVALALRRASRRLRSIALEGSSRHLMTDVWTSAGVLVGLGLVAATGWLWMDALVAIAVGINILVEGARLVRASAQGLMDASLAVEEVSVIETVLRGFAPRGVEHANLRTRSAGAESFIYVDVRVPPDWTILRTHDLLDEIEAAVLKVHPGARVFTHPEPISEKGG